MAVPHPERDGSLRLTRRDYSELIPLVRYRYRPSHPDVQRLITRPRDVTVSLDARLQDALATLMEERFTHEGYRRGAAIVVDVATRDVLAAVSYPWPGATTDDEEGEDSSLDRVHYGLYPPGSIFKLVTAVAALRADPALAQRPFMCERLPDHRIGHRVPGWRRPVHDDLSMSAPHGALTLADALVVSCNAYFAQLAVQAGTDAIRGTAADFDIATASPDTASRLRANLPYAGFGQGEVVTTPARFAGVVGAIAGRGLLSPNRWILEPAPVAEPRRVVSERDAGDLAQAMRAVVTRGTGRVLNGNSVAIAGKTGSAEVDGQTSHAWFAGFAPYQRSGPQIAFVVLIENGGSGGRAAAPLAGDLVDLARQLRIIE